MTRFLAGAAAALALLCAPHATAATTQEFCVSWGPTLPSVPRGVCIPVDFPTCSTALPR